jgi:phage terminase small subunit
MCASHAGCFFVAHEEGGVMPKKRQRPDWAKIRHEYENSDASFTSLMHQYGIPEGTIRARYSRERWRKTKGKPVDASQKKDDASKIKPPQEAKTVPLVAEVRPAKEDGLTVKQQQFVLEYLIDLNATQAAIRAGYSAKTAYSQGQRLLKNVEVNAAIDAAKAERAERTKLNGDMVVTELAKLGFSNMRRFTKWGPNGVTLKDSDELSDEDAAAVAEVSETTTLVGGTVKFKLYNKKHALDSLGRHFGIFKGQPQGASKEQLVKLIESMEAAARAGLQSKTS